MQTGRYVIALGGNALSPAAIRSASGAIAALHVSGNEVAVTHGNGPQVGELAVSSRLSLSILTAQTEAWIGSILEEGIASALARLGAKKSYDTVEIVLTRVAVSPRSRAFRNPTKPIGRYYSRAEAEMNRRHGIAVRKFAAGYRRVVPSPEPLRITEVDDIKRMLAHGKIVIACGGGGIAVSAGRVKQEYLDAVIDKDRASALLAEQIGADAMFILTNVDGVYRDYGRKGQSLIEKMDVKEASIMLRDLEEGSMRPKVEACVRFVRATGKIAGIGNISHPEKVFSLRCLTLITP